MKLLFLTQTYPRFEGDTAGPFIRDLARGLVRGGDRVTVLAPHAEGAPAERDDDGVVLRTFRYAPERWEVLGYGRSLEKDETVKVAPLLVTPAYLLAAWRALARELRVAEQTEEPYDLMHAHWVVPNGLPAWPLAHRVPLAVGLHGSDVFLAEKPGVRNLVRRVLARTRLLTGCSPELVARVAALGPGTGAGPGSELGMPAERCRVIPYGVDERRFAPDPASGAEPASQPSGESWRERLGIPRDAPLLLTVGRMATKKGFHVLMEVLPALLDHHPGAHVVLAGGGDRLEELRRSAAEMGEKGARVHFPGLVLRGTLPDLYRAADLFVLPAVHDAQGNVDGLPNVILEAMASGLPVVASDLSGIPLAVEPERTGLLVPEGDRPALLAALDRLLGDPETRRAWGAAARQKVLDELTWDAVASRYRAGYEAVLGEAPDDRKNRVDPGADRTLR